MVWKDVLQTVGCNFSTSAPISQWHFTQIVVVSFRKRYLAQNTSKLIRLNGRLGNDWKHGGTNMLYPPISEVRNLFPKLHFAWFWQIIFLWNRNLDIWNCYFMSAVFAILFYTVLLRCGLRYVNAIVQKIRQCHATNQCCSTNQSSYSPKFYMKYVPYTEITNYICHMKASA